MVYMCADNDMDDQSYVDLAEMTRAGSTADVNVIVEIDRSAYDSIPQPCRYVVRHNELQFLDQLPELDMADPANLADFARYTKANYAADNYMLVLWDHGNGWPESLDARRPGPRRQQATSGKGQAAGGRSSELAILKDWSSGNAMSVAGGGLHEALHEVHQALGGKVAILALDACIMQMLETAWEVKDDAQIMVGTENLMPWNGFPYDTFLQTLVNRPTISPLDYARLLPDIFVASYTNGSQGSDAVTLSAIDLTQLGRTIQALNKWLNAACAAAPGDIFHRARQQVQTFSCENIPPTRYDENVDLINYLELAAPFEAAPSPLASFQATIIACASNDSCLANAHGIAIWFPDRYLALKMRHAEYYLLGLARDSGWLHFLSCYFNYDDVKPLPVTLSAVRGSQFPVPNTFSLYWSRSFDLSPVSYDIHEAASAATVFSDAAESLGNWASEGFTATSFDGRPAFYSGISDYRDSTLALRTPIDAGAGAIVSFSIWTNTLEIEDTLGNFRRDVGYVELAWDTSSDKQQAASGNWMPLDSFYGYYPDWTNCRYYIPPLPVPISGLAANRPQRTGQTPSRQRPVSDLLFQTSAYPSFYLRFRISAGSGPHVSGFYVSSVAVQALSGSRDVAASSPADTFKTIYDHPHGNYVYFVIPRDSVGNVGFVSNLASENVNGYAEPYSVPAPITASRATLVCDYPEGEAAKASIFTLSGELVNRFDVSAPRMRFDVLNTSGKALASGVYLVVVETASSRTVGRIAIVR